MTLSRDSCSPRARARAGPAPRASWLGGMACGVAVASWLGVAFAASPAASCRAEPAGERVLVQIAVRELFDRELVRLVRLGLRGQIRLEVALYRKRRLWFDQRRTTEVREAVVLWSLAGNTFLLDGRPLADPGTLAFHLALRPGGGGVQGAEHYVEVSARLEVVTVKSLGQMATWLVRGAGQGGAPPEGEGQAPSPLSRTLISYVAADLARTTAGGCPVR